MKDNKCQEVSIHQLFKKKIEGNKKQVRKTVKIGTNCFLSSKGNASGGKGQKLSVSRIKKAFNE